MIQPEKKQNQEKGWNVRYLPKQIARNYVCQNRTGFKSPDLRIASAYRSTVHVTIII